MKTTTPIAKFNQLTNTNGLISLSLNFDTDTEMTNVDFNVNELRDFMVELNTNVSDGDEITSIKIVGEDIVLTTQDNYEVVIYNDDEFFFIDFLDLSID